MKIISGKYREEPNWQKWVKFKHPEQSGVELTFLKRFAALCRDLGVIGIIPAGYRTPEFQKETIKLVLNITPGSYMKNGAVYNKAGKCIASAPGKSNHNYRIAMDCETQKVKDQSDSMFAKYGLRSPMDHEPWHFEPVETLTMTMAEKVEILSSYKEETEMNVKDFQRIAGLVVDGIAGPKTKAKAQEVQTVIRQILGDETAQLKNDMRIIKETAMKW